VDPNPKVLSGSESEKSSDTDSEPDTVVEWKIVWKIKDHLKEKNLMFFYWKHFFSYVQVPEHILKQLEAPFRKIWGQNISLRIRIRKKIVDPNPKKWVPIHNTAHRFHVRR
jgi:hypothetical protein